jgi:uncharacterized protein
MTREQTISVPTPRGQAPLLLSRPAGTALGTILVYHGLGACKETQRPECRILADAGFVAVGVDAWGHGARRLPDFESVVSGPDSHRALLEMVLFSVEELSAIVDALRARLGDAAGPLGIVGISFGGYIAFEAARRERRLRLAIPILGSPDWTVGARGDEWMLDRSPHLSADAFAPTALLIINAGLDENVPPAAARSFAEALAPHYRDTPDRLRYLEYPGSGHFMREQDWRDAWVTCVDWARRFLATSAR